MKLKSFTLITKILIDPFIVEFTKSIHKNIENESIKKTILNEGLYHFTSEESADKILSSGYIKPTKGILNNHGFGNKVYMFPGIPDFELSKKNLPDKTNPLINGNTEFFAIKLNINEDELGKYKQRLQDNAITYRGKCELPNDRVKKVSIVVDLDKDDKYILREKTEEEIINGYVPSDKLKEKLKEDKSNIFKETVNNYNNEISHAYKALGNIFKGFASSIKGRFNRNKTLPEASGISRDREKINKEDANLKFKLRSLVNNPFDSNNSLNNTNTKIIYVKEQKDR
ncbi:MAG: hypothetical protein N2749_05105 [Clostridia bacterium]|nr:hypothetical protein [Clostridia bacterium]